VLAGPATRAADVDTVDDDRAVVGAVYGGHDSQTSTPQPDRPATTVSALAVAPRLTPSSATTVPPTVG
jgi:hypothetical protein